MMFHEPYFSSPYQNRYSRYGYRYPSYSYPSPTYETYQNDSTLKKESPKMNYQQPKKTTSSKAEPVKETVKEETDTKEDRKAEGPSDAPIFEIFGIKLYFDDILLVCLIFFLYQEGVKDQSLFISLVLLLLS